MKHITTLLLMLQLGLLAGSAQLGVDPVVIWPLAYQGTLSSNGVPVNGPHDIILSLWAGPVGGTQVGASITNSPVEVTNGQFTVLLNGWRTSDLSATNLYVQSALRRSGIGASYVTVLPRQRLSSLPRAAVAENALTISPDALSVANLGTNVLDGRILAPGTVQNDILAPGSVQADRIAAAQVVKSVNGLKDDVSLAAGEGLTLTTTNNTLTVSALPPPFLCSDYYNCYWNLFGNNNINPGVTFLGGVAGELDPLEFRVNNMHAQRFEWSGNGSAGSIPNRIGGAQANSVSSSQGGSSIVGGGSSTQPNRILDGSWSFMGGGNNNIITNHYSAIVGGFGNRIGRGPAGSPHPFGFIGGGEGNNVFGYTAEIGGGRWNFVDASASYGGIVGGLTNYVGGSFGFIGNGKTNRIMTFADFGAIGGGEQNLISDGSDWAIIGGGLRNTVTNLLTTIAGGGNNNVLSRGGSIGGGERNSVFTFSDDATIGGGSDNWVTNAWTTVSGGARNSATGVGSTVGGGQVNHANGSGATIGGGSGNTAGTSVLINHATVAGGTENQAQVNYSTVGGGVGNIVYADTGTIGGGSGNRVTNILGTVGGGAQNIAGGYASTVPGGQQAWAPNYGQQAYASGQFAGAGDAQGSLYVSRNITQNATPTELFLNGVTATERMKVPVNGTWTFQTLVVARDNNAGANFNSAGWRIEGVVEHYGTATYLVCQTVTTFCKDPGAANWTVNPGVWGTGANAGLSLTVTGGTTANPVRWVATTRTSEVIFP